MSNQSANLRLYYDFLSQPSRALHILLKVSGTPFVPCAVNLLEGEHQTDAYKSEINRFQKVPAIIDGEFKLAESVAILRYLASKQYIADYLYPMDLATRTRVDEFLQWQHTGIRTSCSLYFRFVWVEARIFGAPAAAGKVAKYQAEMERDLQLLETLWLKDTRFLVGEELTAADVFGACEVEQIRCAGYKIRARFPKVADWIEAVRNELQPHFDVAHQMVYKYELETMSKL